MKTYQITYETRPHGAIGIFEAFTGRVDVPDDASESDARKAFIDKYGDRFEFRNPIATKLVKE